MRIELQNLQQPIMNFGDTENKRLRYAELCRNSYRRHVEGNFDYKIPNSFYDSWENLINSYYSIVEFSDYDVFFIATNFFMSPAHDSDSYTKILFALNVLSLIRQQLGVFSYPVHFIVPCKNNHRYANKMIPRFHGRCVLFIENQKFFVLNEHLERQARNSFWTQIKNIWQLQESNPSLLYPRYLSNTGNRNVSEDIPNNLLAQEYQNREKENQIGFSKKEISKLLENTENIPDSFLKKLYIELIMMNQ